MEPAPPPPQPVVAISSDSSGKETFGMVTNRRRKFRNDFLLSDVCGQGRRKRFIADSLLRQRLLESSSLQKVVIFYPAGCRGKRSKILREERMAGFLR